MKKVIIIIGLLFVASNCAYAKQSNIAATLEKLNSRMQMLEEKIEHQNELIKTQQSMLAKQRRELDMISTTICTHDKAVCQHKEEIKNQYNTITNVSHKIKDITKALEIHRVQFGEMSDMLPMRDKGRPGLSIQGFEFSGGSTAVFQGTHNANRSGRDKKEARNINASLDMMLFKHFKDFGAAFLHLEGGEGAGIDPDLSVLSGVNRDADNDTNIRMTELWLETYWFDKKITALTGKMDTSVFFDNCAFANDETRQFISDIFRNNPALEFPEDNSIGLIAAIEPCEYCELSLGAFDGNADWNNISDNLFSIAQLTIKPKLFDKEGNYRFYIWDNDSYHQRLSSEADIARDPDNPDLLNFNKDTNWGMGLCFDQYLTEHIGMFVRFGNQDRRPSIVQYSWSTGFHMEGGMWGRKDDTAGMAIGQLIPGKDYRKADYERKGKNEGHVEMYYRWVFNDFVEFGPNFQLVWNPNAADAIEHDTIWIYGARAQVNF